MLNIIRYVNSRMFSFVNYLTSVSFQVFPLVLFEVCYYFYSHQGQGAFLSPFGCFELFLEDLRNSLEVKAWFDNDLVFLLTCDHQLSVYVTQLLTANPDLQLPGNFQKIPLKEYCSTGQQQS